MNHSLVINESVLIDAPPEKVWETLTVPEKIKEYLFGTETITDWKVGSEIIFQGTYGENNEHSYRDKGVVVELVPESVLSYRYWSGFSGLEDKPENYAIVTYRLEPEGSSTRFTWYQKGFCNAERHQHAQEGMRAFLEKIKGIAER